MGQADRPEPDGEASSPVTLADEVAAGPAAPTPSWPAVAGTEVLPDGAVVGRFVIERLLGVGGAGVVYAARDPELDRTIALKVLRRELADRPDARTRFLREAQALARVSHPNVIAVYDVGAADGCTFIAMEYLAARTLGEWLADARPSWSEALAVMVKAGQGLAAAHAAGLIHRDFKPGNVLVGLDGRVVVTDFGLARSVMEADADAAPEAREERPARANQLAASITRHGAVQGTPAYMAPEQRAGLPADARSDQYSFCLTLEEAVLGGPAARPEEARRRRGPGDGARIPRWLQRTIARGMAPDPAARHPGMDRVLAELTRGPLRRRRRARWAVGSLAAIATVSAAVAAVRSIDRSELPPCSGAEERIGRVWAPAAADRVRAAFARTGRRHAAESARRVSARLDQLAAKWAGMHRSACLATARGEQSPELLDRRMLCLDRRLIQIEAVVDRLQQADEIVVDRAPELVTDLDPLGQCADAAALLAQAPAPVDPARRAALAAAERTIDQAELDRRLGRDEQAIETARRVLELERGLDAPPLAARAGRVLGRALEDLGRPAEARDSLAAAQRVAERAGDAKLAVHIGIDLLQVVGVRQERFGEAQLLGQVLQAALERPELRGDPDLRARMLTALGSIATHERQLERALALQREALAEVRRARPALSEEVAAAEENLGVALRDMVRQDEARIHYREALAIRRRLLGHEHPLTANALINLGVTYLDVSDLAQARVLLDQALAILEKAPSYRSYQSLLNNLGELERMAGNLERSRDLHLRALQVRLEQLGPDHPSVGLSLSCLGRVVREQGDLAQGLALHRKAVALFERAGHAEHFRHAGALAESGEGLRRFGRPEAALETIDRALALYRARTDAWNSVPLYYRALALLDLGRRREAIETLEQVTDDLSARGADGARARFTLARALEPDRPTTDRARELARSAMDAFAALGASAQRAEVEAYLAGRAPAPR